MNKLACLFCGFLMMAVMQQTHAAKRLGPPIEDLQSDPERIRIVIAQATEKSKANRILFSISERLSGEAPDEVLLRTDAQSFADVVAGNSYVVAWSYKRRNRRLVEGWEVDPDGPFMVQLMGMGATALFEDTPDTRFLFAPGSIDVSGNKKQQIDALLGQMQRQDFRSRGLVISELYLRPDLIEAMQPAQADVLKRVLQKQQLDPQHRDFIYRSALRLPAGMTTPWLAEEFRKTITLHGSQYDLSSFVPGLVRTAARGLQQLGEESDIELLSTLLYSNNPGVSRAALDAMDHIDPGVTLVKAEQAIGQGGIHGDTRSDLQRYISQAKSR
jgi:hypothetical protein